MEYLTKNSISVSSLNEAITIQQVLINNNYITMISKEEGRYIINYIWSEYCDRNDVVFIDKEDYEENIFSLLNRKEANE